MKNIDIRHLKRKAEIAEEYNTVMYASKMFRERGIKLVKSHDYYTEELNSYINNFPQVYMTKENAKKLNGIRRKLSALSKSSAESLVESIVGFTSSIPLFSHINLLNYNKAGLKEGVNQKSDICVEIFNKNGDMVTTKHFSLKQYEKFSDPQVASGTYLSTIAGLAFEPLGRGKFERPDGRTFVSKNHTDLKQAFRKYYGDETVLLIDDLINITKEAHKLRTVPRRPSNLDKIRKNIGNSAVIPFMAILKIVNKANPSDFAGRFLNRSGLRVNPKKEMIYSALNGKIPITFNSLLDKEFSSFIKEINQQNIKTKVVRSGENQQGQGIAILFNNADKTLLRATVPLTININGAWANADRWCAKSKMHVKRGHIRPAKAMELDTSTNCYVKLKTPVFNPILKLRRKK